MDVMRGWARLVGAPVAVLAVSGVWLACGGDDGVAVDEGLWRECST